MIKAVSQPVWVPDKRQWLVEYTVNDKDAGIYVQKVWCEALVSAENYIKFVKGRIK